MRDDARRIAANIAKLTGAFAKGLMPLHHAQRAVGPFAEC
jgi:hypothetical protein